MNKFLSDKATEIEELKQRISDKITSAYGAELIARSEQFFLEKQIQELKEKESHKFDFTIAELERVKEFAEKNKFVWHYIPGKRSFKFEIETKTFSGK